MSRFQNFLTKKKTGTEKPIEKPIAATSQKITNTENKHHFSQPQMQRTFQEPKQSNFKVFSPITQVVDANNILHKIELKKSSNKQYGLSNRLNLPTQKQQLKQEQPAPPKRQVFPQLILMGPFDTLNSDQQLKNLEQLMVQCNKTTIIKWIKNKNQGKTCPQDFRNIQMIVDESFWCIDMQKIIQMLIKEQKSFNSCIRMLPRFNCSQSATFTRTQVYLLIASMFMCIIPYQMNNQLVSFTELMALRPVDEKYKHKPPVRLEKLKCVVNYLKHMLKHEQWSNEKVTFERIYRSDPFYKNSVKKPLSNVIIEQGKIQSGYCKGIIIDFANSNVGGGFLTNGCAQQEILFSIFPEMIITKLLCETLSDNQAIIVYGARRVNNYEAYSYQFKFNGTYRSLQEDFSKSCIVAVDAIDYKQGVMNKTMQYGQRFIRRELHKIHLGISAAKQKLKDVTEVYTGRWGCGAFAADEFLKFCIQWIACSECELEMHFFTEGERAVKQLMLLVENLRHLDTLELLMIIEAFGKDGRADQKGFIQFLKYYI